MKFPLRALSLAAAALVPLSGCKEPPVGSKARPFTMYFVPSVDAEGIAVSADKISDYLEEALSQRIYEGKRRFHIKSSIPASYIAVVEAFGTNKADFAALNTFSYVLAKDVKKYDVEAILTVVRGKNERSYKGQIIAHVDSGVDSVEDLNGRKFGFTDPASTAGFIMPSKLFKDKGVEIGEAVFGKKHDIVVTMVYQRQVDAGATYYSPPKTVVEDGVEKTVIRDARAKVKTQFPDVEDKVKIVGFTDDIPNDPWVIRKNIFEEPERNRELEEAIAEALIAFAATPEGKKALDELYSITGLVRASDDTYDPLRKALGETDIDLEGLLRKK